GEATSTRELRREKEAQLSSCIKQIRKDCEEMLKNKMEEIMQYNNTTNHPQSINTTHNRYRRHKCFHCKQRGYIIKFCPMDDKNKDKATEMNTSESAKGTKELLKPTKPSVDLKYPKCIHFQTKGILKGTDQDKLDDQKQFLFTYEMGEVMIKNDGQGYLIPGVYYAPEVTLNILSIDLLEKQGFEILYDDDRCSLKEDTSMEEDSIRIKDNIYSTRVHTFNEKRFDKVVKWFYNHYLEKSLPGPIPPTINGVKIYLFDLYKLVEGLGGYLSMYFGQEFGTIREILGTNFIAGLLKAKDRSIKRSSATLGAASKLTAILETYLFQVIRSHLQVPSQGQQLIMKVAQNWSIWNYHGSYHLLGSLIHDTIV
nr:ARID DNA-binding domain-containing protein [Tanacetum cinerariifolium]